MSSVLIGCGGGSGDGGSPDIQTREVSVNLNALEIGAQPMMDESGVYSASQTDVNEYQHELVTWSYVLCISDAIGERCHNDISLYDSLTLQIAGEAQIAFFHDYYDDYAQSDYYTVGMETLSVGSEQADITLNLYNQKWSYVTVETSPYVVTDPTLGHNEMRLSNSGEYWYYYTQEATELVIQTVNGPLTTDITNPMVNYHYSYSLKETDPSDPIRDGDIGWVIDREWEQPIPIELETPGPRTGWTLISEDHYDNNYSSEYHLFEQNNKVTREQKPITEEYVFDNANEYTFNHNGDSWDESSQFVYKSTPTLFEQYDDGEEDMIRVNVQDNEHEFSVSINKSHRLDPESMGHSIQVYISLSDSNWVNLNVHEESDDFGWRSMDCSGNLIDQNLDCYGDIDTQIPMSSVQAFYDAFTEDYDRAIRTDWVYHLVQKQAQN